MRHRIGKERGFMVTGVGIRIGYYYWDGNRNRNGHWYGHGME